MGREWGKGYALIELMVGLALILIVLSGVASMQDYANQANRNNQQQVESVFLQTEIYNILKDTSSCSDSFQNFPVPNNGTGNYTHPTIIYKPGGIPSGPAFQTGMTYSNGLLEIQRMDLGEFEFDNPAFPNIGKAKLKIVIGKTGTPLGPRSIAKDIRLQVAKDAVAPFHVTNCAAIGGSHKDIWLQNSDLSIYYKNIIGAPTKVGIGTDTPALALHVASDAPVDDGIIIEQANNTANQNPNFTGRKARGNLAGKAAVQNGDEITEVGGMGYDGTKYLYSADMRAVVDGPVGINSVPTRLEFRTQGVINNFVAPPTRMTIDSQGDVTITGCLKNSLGATLAGVCLSDKRLKSEIESFDLGLETLLGLNPKRYKFNGLGGTKKSSESVPGFIAQEVEEVAPELIHKSKVLMRATDKQLTEVKQVDYSALIYVVINAIKEFYDQWRTDSAIKDSEIRILKERLEGSEKENIAILTYLCKKDPNADLCRKNN